jgi:hypothetical protein
VCRQGPKFDQGGPRAFRIGSDKAMFGVGFDPRGAVDGASDQEYVAHRDEPTGSARAR